MRIRNQVWTPDPADATGIVTVQEMRDHVGLVLAVDEAVLEGCIAGAVAHVEAATQRLLLRRGCTLQVPHLPPNDIAMDLPGGALGEVASVEVDGTVLDPGAYQAAGHSPARLWPLASWPAVQGRGLPVTVTYTAGPVSPHPDLVIAVKLIAALLWRQRYAAEPETLAEVPFGARRLMDVHRIYPT